MVLKLGEAGAFQLLVSSQVLAEIENVLRRKAAGTMGLLALLLDRSGVDVVPAPAPEALDASRALLDYLPDALILAAAWTAGVDYFVTLDRKHFLGNPLVESAVPFQIGTPGSCLAWYRA